MSLQKEYDENRFFSETNYEEDNENLAHKKEVRKKLEDYMERKRLQEELEDELDGEFNWDDFKY